MELDPTFIAVDADARLGDVLDLMAELAPARVIVREAPGFGDFDDDEDDVFYVFEAGELTHLDAPREQRIGEFVMSAADRPAATLDPLRAPLRRGRAVRSRAAAAKTVVLSNGIPEGLAAAPASAPRNGGDGERGRALAVAADYPRSVAIETTMSPVIRLSAETAGPDAIPIVAAAGDLIDVFVSPRSGFVVEGRPEGQLRVADAEPLPIQVKLRAAAVGVGSITLYARC